MAYPTVDLSLVPDLVARDAALLSPNPTPAMMDAQVALVEETISILRDYNPHLRAIDDDEMYCAVALAFAEVNGGEWCGA